MKRERTRELAYVINVGFLATHQVDAAYWHEWDVFGVPGGIRFFLVFNMIAVTLLAFGLLRLSQGQPGGRAWSLLCAGTGAMTVALHAIFLFRDRDPFWNPMSLGLLAAIGVTSLLQFAVDLSRHRSSKSSSGA